MLSSTCKGAVEHEYDFGGLDVGAPSIEKAIERQTVLVCKSPSDWLAAAKAVLADYGTGSGTLPSGITVITGVSQSRHGATLQNTDPGKLLALFCKKYGQAPACK